MEDPNETLKRIRSVVESILNGGSDGSYEQELAEAIDNLDEWLSSGGLLPSEWCFKPHELATITYRYKDKEVTAYVPPF